MIENLLRMENNLKIDRFHHPGNHFYKPFGSSTEIAAMLLMQNSFVTQLTEKQAQIPYITTKKNT
jgi:hypothetical protein